MLTSEEMLKVSTGFLMEYIQYDGVWVVVERDCDSIRMIQVNSDEACSLTVYIDDPQLCSVHL